MGPDWRFCKCNLSSSKWRWKRFPHYKPSVSGVYRRRELPSQKASDMEIRLFSVVGLKSYWTNGVYQVIWNVVVLMWRQLNSVLSATHSGILLKMVCRKQSYLRWILLLIPLLYWKQFILFKVSYKMHHKQSRDLIAWSGFVQSAANYIKVEIRGCVNPVDQHFHPRISGMVYNCGLIYSLT